MHIKGPHRDTSQLVRGRQLRSLVWGEIMVCWETEMAYDVDDVDTTVN